MHSTQDVPTTQLRAYHELGWKVTPIWWITDAGACACPLGSDCPPQRAGKHPMLQEWETSRLDSWSDIKATWRGWPAANIGVLTGAPSGHWVLDYDPANADDTARRLAETLGPAHVRTGGGGLHWRYGFDSASPVSNSPGKLPKGLDVRSTGGYVVAPPSRSAKGAYAELQPARSGLLVQPATLLEWIGRPAPAEVRAPSNGSAPISDRYASAAIDAVLDEIRALPGGRRNQEGWRLARRVRELAAGADVDAEHYGPAVLDALMSTGLPAGEARNLWYVRSARRAVEPARASGGGQQVVIETPVVAPMATGGTVVQFPQVRANDDTSSLASPPSRVSLRERLKPRSALATMRRPAPLIRGVLNLDSDAWLIGASGSGKSFVGLDWACHVATGRPWSGRPVEQGRVLFVAAEGASGVLQRVDAWEKVHQPVGDDLVVLPVAVQAIEPGGFRETEDWRELMEIAAEMRPKLIVLDTQARMSVGLNENDAGQMGRWIQAVSALRAAAGGACVLVVHHTGRGGAGDARGSSAIDAAQDMEWTVTREGPKGSMRIKLACSKSKDGRDDLEWGADLVVIDLPGDEHGERSSLVVRYEAEGYIRPPEPDFVAQPLNNQSEVLHILREVGDPDGDTKAELLRKINDLRKQRGVQRPMPVTSLSSALSSSSEKRQGLLEKGLVEQVGRRWRIAHESPEAIPRSAGAWVQA